MSGQLTKDLLLRVFARLNEKLREADEHGEVYIVGGAMMILAHDAPRATNDVDSHIRRGRRAITKAVAEIGDAQGLEPGTITDLMDETGVDEAQAATMFRKVTGKTAR